MGHVNHSPLYTQNIFHYTFNCSQMQKQVPYEFKVGIKILTNRLEQRGTGVLLEEEFNATEDSTVIFEALATFRHYSTFS